MRLPMHSLAAAAAAAVCCAVRCAQTGKGGKGVQARPVHNMILQRMREFSKMNLLKREVMRLIASEINADYLVGAGPSCRLCA